MFDLWDISFLSRSHFGNSNKMVFPNYYLDTTSEVFWATWTMKRAKLGLGLAEKHRFGYFGFEQIYGKLDFNRQKNIQMFNNGIQQILDILELDRWNLNRHSKMLEFNRYFQMIIFSLHYPLWAKRTGKV